MEQKKTNGYGITSMILGIIGLITACLFFGIIPCIIGMIFGIVGLFQKGKSKISAVVGISCSSIGIMIFLIILLVVNLGNNDNENNNNRNNNNSIVEENLYVDDETNDIEIEKDNLIDQTEDIVIENSEESEVINQENVITEEDYKNLCEEMYYDDFFVLEPQLYDYVKFYGFTSQKYKYTLSDIQGILVEDITEKYNLELNCLSCCILHEETKDDLVRSYFGKSVYIMFEKDSTYNLDSFNTGEYVVVYGQVIQNENGIYILPEYIEYQ